MIIWNFTLWVVVLQLYNGGKVHDAHMGTTTIKIDNVTKQTIVIINTIKPWQID
jgi:hypothetical protein